MGAKEARVGTGEAKNTPTTDWVALLREQGAAHVSYHNRITFLDRYFKDIEQLPKSTVGLKYAERKGALPHHSSGAIQVSEALSMFLQRAFHSRPEAVNNLLVISPDGNPTTEIVYQMWVRNPRITVVAPSANAYKPLLFHMFFPKTEAEAFIEDIQTNPDLLETTFAGIYPDRNLPRIKAETVRFYRTDTNIVPQIYKSHDLGNPEFLNHLPTLKFETPIGNYALPSATKATRPQRRHTQPPQR